MTMLCTNQQYPILSLACQLKRIPVVTIFEFSIFGLALYIILHIFLQSILLLKHTNETLFSSHRQKELIHIKSSTITIPIIFHQRPRPTELYSQID